MSLTYSFAALKTNTCAFPILFPASNILSPRVYETKASSSHSQQNSSLESLSPGLCLPASNQRRQTSHVDVRSMPHTRGTLAHSSQLQTDTWQQESANLQDRSFRNGALCGDEENVQGEVISEAVVDMVTLGNMCVDVFVDVEELPPEEREAKLRYMQKLVEAPPDESFWESGGFSNSLIAAARLGLKCSAIGHLGNDKFGDFLLRIMRQEGIDFHEFYRGGDPAITDKLPLHNSEPPTQSPHSGGYQGSENDRSQGGKGFQNKVTVKTDQVTSKVTNPVSDTVTTPVSNLVPNPVTDPVTNPYVETLFCWVMIDPEHNHAFCSRFDFDSNPMFSSLLRLPSSLETLMKKSKALFINGFIFDEVPTYGIISAARLARESGAAVFFDPGPRTFVLTRGGEEGKEALEKVIGVSSVLMLTAEEAEALTGVADPYASARSLLAGKRNRNGDGGDAGGGNRCGLEWVVVKRGALGCVVATRGGVWSMPGFSVEVCDTVGCGDSFGAALVLGFTRGWGEGAVMALANAVGAATAMGQGAGRNVARAGRVEEILTGALQADGEVDMSKLNCGEFGDRAEYGFEPHGGEGVKEKMNVSLKEAIEGALRLLRSSLEGSKMRS